MICSVNIVRSVNTKFLSVREILSSSSFYQFCSWCQDRHIPSIFVSSVNNRQLRNVLSILAVPQFCQFQQFLSSVNSGTSSVLPALAVPQPCQLWQLLSPASSGSSSVLSELELLPRNNAQWINVHATHYIVTVSPVHFVWNILNS